MECLGPKHYFLSWVSFFVPIALLMVSVRDDLGGIIVMLVGAGAVAAGATVALLRLLARATHKSDESAPQ
jgi:hypothetical protein